jgi:hypothetical protein
MLAVLDDAIRSYQLNYRSTIGERRRLFNEAEEWLFTRSESGPFACDTICDAIGIDPEYLRGGLKQWCRKQFEKPESADPSPRVLRTSVRRQRDPQTHRARPSTSSHPGSLPLRATGRSEVLKGG